MMTKCPVFIKVNWTFYSICFKDIKMKTTDYITHTIDRLPKRYIFTYADFTNEVNNKEAIIKALNRILPKILPYICYII